MFSLRALWAAISTISSDPELSFHPVAVFSLHFVIIVTLLVLQFLCQGVIHAREVESFAVWKDLASELLLRPLQHLPVKCYLEVSLVSSGQQNGLVNVTGELGQRRAL